MTLMKWRYRNGKEHLVSINLSENWSKILTVIIIILFCVYCKIKYSKDYIMHAVYNISW